MRGHREDRSRSGRQPIPARGAAHRCSTPRRPRSSTRATRRASRATSIARCSSGDAGRLHAVPPHLHRARHARSPSTPTARTRSARRRADAGCWEADERVLVPHRRRQRRPDRDLDGRRPRRVHAAADRAPLGVDHDRLLEAGRRRARSSTGRRRRRASGAPTSRPPSPRTTSPASRARRTRTPTDKVKCVACHVVSRDGKYMAAPVSAMSGNSLWVMEVTRDGAAQPAGQADRQHRRPRLRDHLARRRHRRGGLGRQDVDGRSRDRRASGANLPLGGLEGHPPRLVARQHAGRVRDRRGRRARRARASRHPAGQNGAWGAPTIIVGPTAGRRSDEPVSRCTRRTASGSPSRAARRAATAT